MSIFPFIDSNFEVPEANTEAAEALREYAWDFEKDDFLLVDGKLVIVEGMEALKIWIYKALKTARFKSLAYSWNYGSELDSVIGLSGLSKSVRESEIKRFIREALRINPKIKDVLKLNSYLNDDKLNLEFTADTDYGEVIINATI